MAKCDYCGSTIVIGGVRQGDLRFCNQRCHQNGALLALAKNVPLDLLEQRVTEVHQGSCPRCSGSGPVDVHTSYRVWSALLLTQWSSHPQVSCRSCGVKAKVGNGLLTMVIGWWGFPWGLIMTPIQLVRNFGGIFTTPDPAQPSKDLHRLVCLNIAAQLAAAAPPPLSTPPKLPARTDV